MTQIQKAFMFPLIVAVAILGGLMAWVYECVVICIPATIGAIIRTVEDMYREG